MLTLFYKPSCPFCHRVIDEAETLGIAMNLKDIGADTEALDELLEKGGKQMVPFLVDTEHGIEMYESVDIIEHLHKHHTKGKSNDNTN
jgi:glutathione S-transferase